MDQNIEALRVRMSDAPLDVDNVSADPIAQFQRWFDQATQAQVFEPTAATLATVNDHGQPSARMVLVKSVDQNGFCFFTNYDSPKARELSNNPRAALAFWWKEIHRQVRIQGSVEKTSAELSDAYFASRPRGSQLGAISPQSEVIQDRRELVEWVQASEKRCGSGAVPRPDSWGGFRLIPTAFEFWQSRLDRLHDRISYRRDSSGDWRTQRLAP